MEENLKRKLENYENQLKEMNQNVEKQRLEQERINQEKLLKQKIEALEAEKAKKKREFEIREKNELARLENIKKNSRICT